MSALISLLAVIIAIVLVWAGVTGAGLQYFFGVILPYTAIAIFIVGVVYRVIGWARSPVPFRIPTTCGQQKSLDWIKPDKLEAPPSPLHAFFRMALEVLFFRSLFRNTKAQLLDGPRIVYGPTKWLWMAGLAFHWTFLIVLIRHFKYFAEPTPEWILTIQNLDGFFQVGLPIFYLTDGIILASLTYLFVRRIVSPQLRYLSMAGDYFPLFLLGAIIVTGGIMRYTTLRVDITDVKMLATGLASFSPVVPSTIGQSSLSISPWSVCC